MKNHQYQIVFAGDLREPSFRMSTVIDQIQAVTKAGYRTGFVQLTGDHADRPSRIHQDIARLRDIGRLTQTDPDQVISADMLIVTDPSAFIHRPRRILQIDAEVRLILVPHGPISADGRELYDWAQIHQYASETLPGEILWAPMSTLVREELRHLEPRPILSNVDWHPCVETAEWCQDRACYCSSRPVIGRAGPADGQSWPTNPAEILSLYPDDPQFLVRIFNGGSVLREHIGPYPRNWEIISSEHVGEREFLSSIDFFVHSHHPGRVGLVDPSLLKAMASGAVAILPRSYEPIFGDAAVYAEPHQVRTKVSALYADRSRYKAASDAGRRSVTNGFDAQGMIARIGALIGGPDSGGGSGTAKQRSDGIHASRSRRRVMFITINGVGMGHLTRMLAIARRCSSLIEPVFVTMSQALKVLREQGYLAEFIPSRQYLDCDIHQWNGFLRDELNEMMSFYDPAVVVFDGNVPYQGLIDAIKANPDPWFIWSRRGMWRTDNGDIVRRETYFDAVLEPGDLAAVDDHGITARHRDRTHHVSPVRLLDTSEMLSREDARAELGLDPERPAVLIQLGAGNNFDYRSVHNTAITHIAKQYDAQISVGEWLISDQPLDLPETVVRMPGYPFAKYFKAFDLAVSAVGYNSFHELLFAGLPTILVPNEAMGQDNQLSRALYADRRGLAICVRTKEVYKLTATIDKLFLPHERERLRSNLAGLDPANGAAEAASLVEEMAYSRRVGHRQHL